MCVEFEQVIGNDGWMWVEVELSLFCRFLEKEIGFDFLFSDWRWVSWGSRWNGVEIVVDGWGGSKFLRFVNSGVGA